jgi:hypothetical protein
MFGGMDIITVEAGAVIKDGDEELTVTDTEAVTKGRKIYMTEKNVAALRAHPDVTNAKDGIN